MALTAEGAAAGTPSTMGPEQFDDPGSVDHRADIYALGCVLFHALTGQPAFTGKGLTAIIRAKTGADASQVESSVPKVVAAFASRMMAAERSDRPQSYADVITDCRELLQTAGKQAPAAKSAGIEYAMLGLLTASAGLAFWVVQRGGEQQQETLELPAPRHPAELASAEAKQRRAAKPAPPTPTTDSDQGKSEPAAAEQLEHQPVERPAQVPAQEPKVKAEEPSAETEPQAQEEVPPVPLPPELTQLAGLRRQAGSLVQVRAQASHPEEAELIYAWSWLTSTGEEPGLRQDATTQVSVQVSAGPELPSAQSSASITLYPRAASITKKRALIRASDFPAPYFWKVWQGGKNFGQTMDSSGIFSSGKTCTIAGTPLPGGDWFLAGILVAIDIEDPPAELGLVIHYPHGKRYSVQLVQEQAPDGTPAAELILRTQNKRGDGWSDPRFVSTLGTLVLPEAGLPITVTRRENTLSMQAGGLSTTFTEPIAPDGLGFCVTGGAGVLRDPCLVPL